MLEMMLTMMEMMMINLWIRENGGGSPTFLAGDECWGERGLVVLIGRPASGAESCESTEMSENIGALSCLFVFAIRDLVCHFLVLYSSLWDIGVSFCLIGWCDSLCMVLFCLLS